MVEKLGIRDLNVHDVIKDMAKNFGISYDEEHHEMCIRIPDELGSGYVKAIQFENGLGILESDYLLKKKFHIEMQKGVIHPLKIIFNRESAFDHKFNGKEEEHRIDHLESAILSSNSKHTHVFKMPANEPICTFSIQINRKLFEKKIDAFLSDMDENTETLFRDVNGINLYFHKSHYSLDISRFIEEFTECELQGFMKAVYQEGKAYEILTHHLKQYLDDLNEPDKRKILRQSTVNRIEKAVDLIKEEIATVGNVVALANDVGLNQNTLQAGFKQLYGKSVNQFIRDERIEMAKDLIETSNMNITEITYAIGINSRSYFSKLFKEKFSVSPKHYLQKIREEGRKTS
ncbi:helix-turn-helix transcriptional regulator [Aggregatimonas sangjinii]|uniref:Helix-turn-helix transcriptional regulator n=1 Tax=Aggregatimonas sangjinii TaxID=2583587 RepID=A0A5B7SXN2_9FLAO|nr:AraC family transcriptional regulator [Aggregatimonas sangjinii]QCX01963.1 helix-turn-helix transcriptional regulator [Aggregatimonas sangjinii]